MLPIFTGLLGTLVGLILGHRLSLGRDKRREFNEESLPLFEVLENQRGDLSNGHPPRQSEAIAKESFVRLKQHLSTMKAMRLDRDLDEYQKALDNLGYYHQGEYVISQPEPLITAIEQLQKHVRRK